MRFLDWGGQDSSPTVRAGSPMFRQPDGRRFDVTPTPNPNDRVTGRHPRSFEGWEADVHVEIEAAVGVQVLRGLVQLGPALPKLGRGGLRCPPGRGPRGVTTAPKIAAWTPAAAWAAIVSPKWRPTRPSCGEAATDTSRPAQWSRCISASPASRGAAPGLRRGRPTSTSDGGRPTLPTRRPSRIAGWMDAGVRSPIRHSGSRACSASTHRQSEAS